MSTETTTRPLHIIAREIRADWPRVNYAAEPYLRAMASLDTVRDRYGYDSGAEIVLRFLGNAQSWRGETARRVKAELRAALAAS